MAMKFTVNKKTTEAERAFIENAPLKAAAIRKNKNITVCMTTDQFQQFRDFIIRHEYPQAYFVRKAIFSMMDAEDNPQETPKEEPAEDIWKDEPFTVEDAAAHWGVDPKEINEVITGQNGPRFGLRECKKIGAKIWLVTRAGMERVFGEEKNPSAKANEK